VKVVGDANEVLPGETDKFPVDRPGRDRAAQELGRKGGKARAASLSKQRRTEIARQAAAKRWDKGRP
jgi:hypothetical protein